MLLFENRERFIEPIAEILKKATGERLQDQCTALLTKLFKEGHTQAAPPIEAFLLSKRGRRAIDDAHKMLGRRGVALILQNHEKFDDAELENLGFWIGVRIGERRLEDYIKRLERSFPGASRLRKSDSDTGPNTRDHSWTIPGTKVPISNASVGKLTEGDLLKLAQLALSTDSRSVLGRIRACFRRARIPFPIPADQVIAHAQTVENALIKHRVLLFIEDQRNPEIRDFALIALRSRNWEEIHTSFCLLEKNATPEDIALMYEVLLESLGKDEEFHSLTVCTLNLEIRPSSEILHLIYENTHCTICRGTCVQQMGRRRLMTPALWQEISEDADPWLRRKARRALRRLSSTGT